MTDRSDGPKPLVELDEAGHTYGMGPTAVVAVHSASASVSSGDRIALLGPSGSGKSTLLHMMAGLQPATSGTIRWPRFDGTPLGRPWLAGVVFQGPTLVPTLTAEHNAALPLLIDGIAEARARAIARAALETVGLGWARERLPEQLSGGQAQRVAVARVLSAGPALILADEPTGQLDRETAAGVIDALLGTAERLDAALVIATHDEELADRFPTRWSMADGLLAQPTAVTR